MTYILGLKQPGLNAIISDARISWKSNDNGWEGDNTALKTGLFFTGCIFGRVGNSEHSANFITRFKSRIESVSDNTQECWRQLQVFVDEYPFSSSPDNHFQLLLSCRLDETPEFYILDSKTGLSKQDDTSAISVVTLGSGKTILDVQVANDFLTRIEKVQNYMIDSGEFHSLKFIRYITLYLLCLWLSELSLTFESSVLNQHQVGGVFHFLCQDSKTEQLQSPAVYIFSTFSPSSQTILGWIYRVAFARGGLYVEIHKPYNPASGLPREETEKHILFDKASSPSLDKISVGQLQQEANDAISKLPFCFFCGFGFTPPQDRKSMGSLLPKDGKYEEVFEPDGQLRAEIKVLINSNFANKQNHTNDTEE
jgi:hypothetical protein